ncbi:MAG: transposase [Opitutaceae bacterium]|nr:transposase [Cytophagales bacterium]
MAQTYRVYDQEGLYFITCTVHQWVDVFTRKIYTDILLDSLRYCQTNKGLEVFAWVIMSNHIHLIIRSKENKLSDIIRDFKKHTSKKIMEAIELNQQESRQKWLLWLLKKDGHIWFWQEGYHGEEIQTPEFLKSKIEYIHLNPVRAGIVEKEEEYLLIVAVIYMVLEKVL